MIVIMQYSTQSHVHSSKSVNGADQGKMRFWLCVTRDVTCDMWRNAYDR